MLSQDLAGTLVRGVSLDSRTTRPGDLYVGLPGTRAHGASFAAAAAARGAVAILTDGAGGALVEAAGAALPVIRTNNPRGAMAVVAARVYGDPSAHMEMFGITGTNGKTTTVFLLEAGLRAAGRRVGTIGTIGFRLDGQPLAADRTTVTTPESPDLQALLAALAERGADAVAMEVSSHALALHRVDATRFDVVAFTNLGRDHLDFHHTMEEYFEAKALLFAPGRARLAVITGDDEYGAELCRRIRAAGSPQLLTTGFGRDADYRVLDWTPLAGVGSRVRLATPTGELGFELDLPGEHNVRNAVTALAMLEAAGHPAPDVLPGLARARVPGRMERVPLEGDAPVVLVDFAHTPQAIASALAAVHAAGGRVIALLGAGGDRDVAKRGPMGRAAAAGADVVVVTDDNPRSEDPVSIRAAVLEGARAQGTAEVIDGGDRRHAISRVLDLATPADVVILMGKGHEQGQQIGDRLVPFDDRVVAQEEWSAMKGSR